LALLSNEAGDAVAFLREVDRIGLFVDNFIEINIEDLSAVPTAFYEDVLVQGWQGFN